MFLITLLMLFIFVVISTFTGCILKRQNHVIDQICYVFIYNHLSDL